MTDEEFTHARRQLSKRPGVWLLLASCAFVAVLSVMWFVPWPNDGRETAHAVPGTAVPKEPVRMSEMSEEMLRNLRMYSSFSATLLEHPPESPALALVARQVVAIANLGGDGSYATGFIVRNGIVVTAAHLIDEGGRSGTLFAHCAGYKVPAIILVADHVHDVMLLSARGCSGETLPVTAATAASDAPLHVYGMTFLDEDGRPAVGYARGTARYPTYDPNPLSGQESVDETTGIDGMLTPELYALHGSAKLGQSGSPVVTEDGTLAGVIVGTDKNGADRSVMIPARAVIRLLTLVGLQDADRPQKEIQ